jgi:hypothetical protein
MSLLECWNVIVGMSCHCMDQCGYELSLYVSVGLCVVIVCISVDMSCHLCVSGDMSCHCMYQWGHELWMRVVVVDESCRCMYQ